MYEFTRTCYYIIRVPLQPPFTNTFTDIFANTALYPCIEEIRSASAGGGAPQCVRTGGRKGGRKGDRRGVR